LKYIIKRFYRWFCSANHKDIGTVYFIVGVFMGLVGRSMRFLIRQELAFPGLLVGDYQLYKRLITAHGLIMIFFLLCQF